MAPSTIYIIRHGEKPDKNGSPPGFIASGKRSLKGLTIRGWHRAGAWASLFGAGLADGYCAPDAIYAVDPDHDPEGEAPSRRPYLTAVPLADKLGQKVRKRVQGREAALVSELADVDGTVLICWEHKRIGTALMPAFFEDELPANVPRQWDSSRYDVVFKLTRQNNSWAFEQLCPCLLAGDRQAPM